MGDTWAFNAEDWHLLPWWGYLFEEGAIVIVSCGGCLTVVGM